MKLQQSMQAQIRERFVIEGMRAGKTVGNPYADGTAAATWWCQGRDKALVGEVALKVLDGVRSSRPDLVESQAGDGWPWVRVREALASMSEGSSDGNDLGSRFMQELLDSAESLTGIADEHGARTLADLFYLYGAILKGGFVDAYAGESALIEIVGALPSASQWMNHIKVAPEGA